MSLLKSVTETKDLTTKAGLMSAISVIAGRMAVLHTDTHEVGVAAMRHAEKHGDVMPMQALLDAFQLSKRGNSFARRKAFMVWVTAFSPIILVDHVDPKNRDRKPGLIKPESVRFKPFECDKAAENPFYDFTIEEVRYTAPADYIKSIFVAHSRLEKDLSGENANTVFAGTKDEGQKTLNTLERIISELGGKDALADLTEQGKKAKAKAKAEVEAA